MSSPLVPTQDLELPQRAPFPAAAIGGGAGAYEALEQVLEHLRTDRLAVFVLPQDPGTAEEVAGRLRGRTQWPVVAAGGGQEVAPNTVYVVRGGQTPVWRDGALVLESGANEEEGKPPVLDLFFRALAVAQGDRAIAVVLSGAGADGVLGMKEVKAAGGITFVQDPASAKVPEMPHSGLQSGFADFALPPPQIGEELTRISSHVYVGPGRVAPPEDGEVLVKLLRAVRAAHKLDFTHYKASTLQRRIERRMALHRLDRMEDYLRLVQGSQSELGLLYRDLLIKVTSFFRDREPFDRLGKDVLHRILESQPQGAPIRVWVPGCATGEEAYSIAMVLLEALGERSDEHRLQIFATDVDEEAIAAGRRGIFPTNIEMDVPSDRLVRFFTRRERHYQVNKLVRDAVVFAPHDLTSDPPFSRLDLISCRNVLIYMQPALQRRVLRVFHHALNPSGWLLLGNAEAVGDASGLFTLVDRKVKLYVRRNITSSATFDPGSGPPVDDPPAAFPAPDPAPRRGRVTVQQMADRKVLERYGPPGVLVNENLEVLQFRGKIGQFLEPATGSATLSLLKLARPELVKELRGAVARCLSQNAQVQVGPLRYREGDATREVGIEVLPVPDPGSRGPSALVLFELGSRAGSHRPPRGKGRVADLERELHSIRGYVQSVVAELETTNEGLQSANEELRTTNEELRSTNDELQISREELQSANEELVTVNEELQRRMLELGWLKDDLHNVIGGLEVAVVGMDLRVRFLSPRAGALLGTSERDAGQPLDQLLSAGADAAALAQVVGHVIESLRAGEQPYQAADGRRYLVRVTPYRSSDHAIKGAVLAFLPRADATL